MASAQRALEEMAENWRVDRERLERLEIALREIANSECTCRGYYTCNGCERVPVVIAEEALEG